MDGECICKEINLYTYWQGLDYAIKTPNIKYLFVLQDYGCIFENVTNLGFFQRINAGFKSTPYFSKQLNISNTDENLIKMFEILGYDLNKRHNDLFFTNFCLGYRKTMTQQLLIEFLGRLIDRYDRKIFLILENLKVHYEKMVAESKIKLNFSFFRLILRNSIQMNI